MTQVVNFIKSVLGENKTIESKEDAKFIRSIIYNNFNIKSCYDNTRIIFSYTDITAHINNNIIINVCNGLILEYPSLKILVNPPNITWAYPSAKILSKSLDNYDVFNIRDGTVVNMYYYNEKWRISTTCGYEMNNVKYNTMSYDDVFDDIFDKLNKSSTYTFGFTHPDFHWANKHKYIWQIKGPPVESIDYQTPIDSTNLTACQMFDNNRSAMDTFIDNGTKHYGYLLRKKNKLTSPDTIPEFLLESTLMSSIRRFIYNKGIVRDVNKYKYDKKLYTSLRAYMGLTSKIPYITLFPQFKKYYKYFDGFFDRLCTSIKNSDESVCEIRRTLEEVMNIETSDDNTIKDTLLTNVNIPLYMSLMSRDK